MGPRPSDKYTIERNNNDGNYEADNCRWATAKEQARNRRTTFYVTYKGKTASLAEHAENCGIPYKRAWERIKRDRMSPEHALSQA